MQVHCVQCKLNLPAVPRNGHTAETSEIFEEHLKCFAKSAQLKIVEGAIQNGNVSNIFRFLLFYSCYLSQAINSNKCSSS